MLLTALAKRLYPKLPTGRAVYHVKVILFAATVGILLGGAIVFILFHFQSKIGK